MTAWLEVVGMMVFKRKKLVYRGPTRLGDVVYSIIIAVLFYAAALLEAVG